MLKDLIPRYVHFFPQTKSSDFLHDYKLIIITQYFQLQNKKRDESWWRALIFLGLRAEPFIVTGQQHCCKMERSNAQLYLDKIKQKTNTPPQKWQSKTKCLNLSTFPRTAHLAQAPRTKHKMPFTLLLKSTNFNELHRTETSFKRPEPHLTAWSQRKFVLLRCMECKRACKSCKHLLIHSEIRAVSLLPAVL